MKLLEYKNQLVLEDFDKNSPEEVRNKIVDDFEIGRSEIDKFQILVAYMSVGSWGCDSSAWFLLRSRETGELFEVHGFHCSCYGFEGQFTPEKTTEEYLKSSNFGLSCGGYDDNENANKAAVVEFLKNL